MEGAYLLERRIEAPDVERLVAPVAQEHARILPVPATHVASAVLHLHKLRLLHRASVELPFGFGVLVVVPVVEPLAWLHRVIRAQLRRAACLLHRLIVPAQLDHKALAPRPPSFGSLDDIDDPGGPRGPALALRPHQLVLYEGALRHTPPLTAAAQRKRPKRDKGGGRLTHGLAM